MKSFINKLWNRLFVHASEQLTKFFYKSAETRYLLDFTAGILALIMGSLMAIILFYHELGKTFIFISAGIVIVLVIVLFSARRNKRIKSYHYFITFLVTYLYGLYIFSTGDNERGMAMFGLVYPILSNYILKRVWGNLLIALELFTSLFADEYLNPLKMPDDTRTLYICLYIIFWLIGIVFEGTKDFMTSLMKKQQKELAHLANNDQLTDMANRRSFYDQIANKNVSGDHLGPMVMLILDVDNFKSINDRYGHNSGDIVLSETAKRIKNNTRSTDICCRWGGEEFLVLAPVKSEKSGIIIAQKICDSISSEPFILDNNQSITVTVSIGVIFCENYSNSDTENMVRYADENLYRAKNNGKNRVCSGTLQIAKA